jgi:hypothetical protein
MLNHHQNNDSRGSRHELGMFFYSSFLFSTNDYLWVVYKWERQCGLIPHDAGTNMIDDERVRQWGTETMNGRRMGATAICVSLFISYFLIYLSTRISMCHHDQHQHDKHVSTCHHRRGEEQGSWRREHPTMMKGARAHLRLEPQVCFSFLFLLYCTNVCL